MLRLLLRTPLPLFNARDLRSHTHLCLLHEPTSKTIEPSSSNSNLTVSYLTNFCGLSSAAALAAAEKVHLKTTENADSFISLLKSHGFTGIQIAKLITKAPFLLSCNTDKKIKPKLEFFLTAGFSNTAVAKLLVANPSILWSSLERKLAPNFHLLKTILGGAKEATVAVGGTIRLLQYNIERDMIPNMKTLEEHGVPRNKIVKLSTFYPRALLRPSARFSKEAAFLKEMGFDPLKMTFVLGIAALCVTRPSNREKKLQLYRSLGWSEEDTALLFKNFPFCLIISAEKIKRAMSFFVEKLKWKHSFLAARPKFLTLSLDKTIIPRYNVFQILESKGLVKRSPLLSYLQITEKRFLDHYVIKYRGQVPEVLEAYKIKLELAKLKEVN